MNNFSKVKNELINLIFELDLKIFFNFHFSNKEILKINNYLELTNFIQDNFFESLYEYDEKNKNHFRSLFSFMKQNNLIITDDYFNTYYLILYFMINVNNDLYISLLENFDKYFNTDYIKMFESDKQNFSQGDFKSIISAYNKYFSEF